MKMYHNFIYYNKASDKFTVTKPVEEIKFSNTEYFVKGSLIVFQETLLFVIIKRILK